MCHEMLLSSPLLIEAEGYLLLTLSSLPASGNSSRLSRAPNTAISLTRSVNQDGRDNSEPYPH